MRAVAARGDTALMFMFQCNSRKGCRRIRAHTLDVGMCLPTRGQASQLREHARHLPLPTSGALKGLHGQTGGTWAVPDAMHGACS